jgi:uncharacterized protein YdaU (DUF1376 family)
MNFYPFHIGDYVSHTRHLSLMEDLAYRRLIDQYYLQEQPLPESVEKCAKLILMRDHHQEVRAVLEEFFELTDSGWISTRCDKEIVGMRKRQEIAREKANKRWSNAKGEPQQSSSNAAAPAIDAPAQNPDAAAVLPVPVPTPTPLPTPTTPNGVKAPAALGLQDLVADGLTLETANEWLAHRKRIKAPMTPKAWEAIKAQATTAGWQIEQAILHCLANGWRGFNSDWVRGRGQPQRQSAHTGFEKVNYNEGINEDGTFD